MISLCRDATKRGMVLMYCKLEKVAVNALAKLFHSEYFKVIKKRAHQPEQFRQILRSYEHDASA